MNDARRRVKVQNESKLEVVKHAYGLSLNQITNQAIDHLYAQLGTTEGGPTNANDNTGTLSEPPRGSN